MLAQTTEGQRSGLGGGCAGRREGNLQKAGSASNTSFYQVSLSNLVPAFPPSTPLTLLSVLSVPSGLSWPERKATSGLQSTGAPCSLLSLAWSKLEGWRMEEGVRGQGSEGTGAVNMSSSGYCQCGVEGTSVTIVKWKNLFWEVERKKGRENW